MNTTRNTTAPIATELWQNASGATLALCDRHANTDAAIDAFDHAGNPFGAPRHNCALVRPRPGNAMRCQHPAHR